MASNEPVNPRFLVDFNEMVSVDVVLLSRNDQRADETGAMISLVEGLRVRVFAPDRDVEGRPKDFSAIGVVALDTDEGVGANTCAGAARSSARRSEAASTRRPAPRSSPVRCTCLFSATI